MSQKTTPSDDASADLYCPECGYNLRGIGSARCPECGLAVDQAALAVSQIPWVHRRTLGRIRAFWRTVGLVVRRPRVLVEELNRPVSYADAARFRWAVVLVNVAVAAALLLAAYLNAWRQGQWGVATTLPEVLEFPLVMAGEPWSGLAMVAGVGLAMWAWAAAQSFIARPSGWSVLRQNRAVALAQCACGPMAFLVAACAVGGAAIWAIASGHVRLDLATEVVVVLALAIAPIALIVLGCGIASRKLRHAAWHASGSRLKRVALELAVSGSLGAMGWLGLVLPLALATAAAVVAESLR